MVELIHFEEEQLNGHLYDKGVHPLRVALSAKMIFIICNDAVPCTLLGQIG